MKIDPENFICPNCEETTIIENPDISLNYTCPLCGNNLKRIFKCTTCDYQESIDQELYSKVARREVHCPKCKARREDEDLSKIIERLRSDDAETRVLAAELLGEIGNKKAGPFLIETLLYDKENHVRGMAAIALGMIGVESALPLLKRLVVEERDPELLDCAKKAIKWLGGKEGYQ